MNQTQSIIFYRNPLEQVMWEGLMNGDLFPIILAAVTFFVVFLSVNAALDKFVPGAWRKAWVSYMSLGVGAVSAFVVVYMMTI